MLSIVLVLSIALGRRQPAGAEVFHGRDYLSSMQKDCPALAAQWSFACTQHGKSLLPARCWQQCRQLGWPTSNSISLIFSRIPILSYCGPEQPGTPEMVKVASAAARPPVTCCSVPAAAGGRA